VTTRSDRRRLAELTGVPVPPPPAATRLLIRVRSALLGARRTVGAPQLTIFDGITALLDNRVLGLLVELELPEHLDRPRSAADLAAATGLAADPLERVLRYAAARGFVRGRRDGRYAPNAVTRLLRRDHPGSWRGWVEFAGSDWCWSAFRGLDGPMRGTATSGLHAATGHPFFTYVHEVRPEAGAVFDRAMAAGARLQAAFLATGLDWTGVRSVCDVGGGTGAALGVLVEFHPQIEATLFDLPEVVARVPDELRDTIAAVGGSFFESGAIPAGRDRYLLLAVVHDWDDDDVVTILRNVAAAMAPNPGASAFVVEAPLPARARDVPAVTSDLLMLALADGGRERTEAEYRALAARAGLALTGATTLASGFVAHELRRNGEGAST
jgi:O-methyltransferase domain